ncbi:MAG: hypothetical protein MUC95_04845 [Spirochaetes bacterium]|nr:hypothetical protein [Spirochaetota bacterium]
MIKLTRVHKAWIVVIILVAILFGINLIFPIFHYTINTAFHCEKCHKEAYRLWNDNKAHRTSITCVYCHTDRPSSEFVYMPQKYFNRKDDMKARCEGCHANYMDKELAKTVTIKMETRDEATGEVKTVYGPITLDAVTCRDNFSCVYCHINLSHDKARTPTNLVRVDYCADCHTGYHSKDAAFQTTPRPTLVIARKGKDKEEILISPGVR